NDWPVAAADSLPRFTHQPPLPTHASPSGLGWDYSIRLLQSARQPDNIEIMTTQQLSPLASVRNFIREVAVSYIISMMTHGRHADVNSWSRRTYSRQMFRRKLIAINNLDNLN